MCIMMDNFPYNDEVGWDELIWSELTHCSAHKLTNASCGLTVHGEQDVQTWTQQGKREAWSAPARRKISPGPARQVDTDFEQHARSYLKTRTRSKGTTGCEQLASPGRGRCRQHPQASADVG